MPRRKTSACNICDHLLMGTSTLCQKVQIVHCGVDLNLLKPDEAHDHSPFRILCVGRLVEKKGVEFLIRACAKLRDDGINNFHCMIVGDGLLRQSLETLTNKLDLALLISFTGAESHDKVLGRLSSSDLFVLPCVCSANNDMDGRVEKYRHRSA